MLLPEQLYPLLLRWLQALKVGAHQTSQQAIAAQLTALLTAQSMRPAPLMRALPSPQPVLAHQRYRRRQRVLTGSRLTPAWLTPALVQGALALVEPLPGRGPWAGQTYLALDSVRCGPWELFTVGVVWHGRVLPVAWAVLPYPWPKGQFTPTVCALLRQVAAVWPPDRPVHMVADRAFPSYALCQTLRALGWGYTLRLQARHWVTVAGQTQQARALLAEASVGTWRAYAGTYGQGAPAVAGTIVVGRGLAVVPPHQNNAGSLRQRARRVGQRAQHAASKNKDRTAALDQWVILFTSHSTVVAARGSYRRRWPIEGSYRDAQGGWDGAHGWDVAHEIARADDPTAVERLAGLWALGTLVQSWVGHQAEQATAPPLVQQVVAGWTTTGRLSVWARGQLALREPSGRLAPWLSETLTVGADRLAAAPRPPPRLSLWPLRQGATGPPAPRGASHCASSGGLALSSLPLPKGAHSYRRDTRAPRNRPVRPARELHW